MTMVCLTAQPDCAEIMTDSAMYTPNGRHIWLIADKVVRLPAIRAAVTFRGHMLAGERWKHAAPKWADKLNDFDQFRDTAQILLTRIMGDEPVHAYAVGYSPREGRFTAFVATPDAGYAPQDITDETHVTPAPPGVQPTDLEADTWAEEGLELPPGDPLAPPATVDEWVTLAKRIHAGRACAPAYGNPPLKVWMGGDVTLTTLTADGIDHRVIHRYTAADFRKMTAGTMHPFGQLGACICASGRRFLDCCLPKVADVACLCGAGKATRDCCMLNDDEARTELADHPDLTDLDAKPGKVGRNEPCPCGSGSKYKKCCALVGAR